MRPWSLQLEGEAPSTPLAGAGPRGRHRCCTDCLCCLVLAAGIGALVSLGLLGFREGNPSALRRFAGGRDYLGRVCGLDPGVEHYRFTYFTLLNGTAAVAPGAWTAQTRALLRPVCTLKCPEGASEVHTASTRDPGLCAGDSYPDWCTWYGDSTAIIANYCVDLEVFGALSGQEGQLLEELRSCAPVLVLAPTVAVVLGFGFLGLVHRCGAFFLWSAALLMVAVPAISGFVVFEHQAGLNRTDAREMSPEKQAQIAYGLWVIAALLAFLTCCFAGTIRNVVAVLKATSHFLRDVPSQMLLPLIFSFVQLILMLSWSYVFILVGSISVREGNMTECLKAGDIYCLEWEWNSKVRNCCLAFMLVMLYWLLNFLHALSYFATAYAVGAWYFAGLDPVTGRKLPAHGGHTCCDLRLSVHAVMKGLTQHSGSLAFGAFVVIVARVARVLLCWAMKVEETEHNNPVARAVLRCSDCVATCVARFLEFISADAYVEIALRGYGFVPAAQAACALAVTRPALFALLVRVVCAVRLLGISVVTGGTAYIFAMLLTAWQPDGDTSFAVPIALAALAGFLVAEVMMHPLSAAARASLHCFCLDEARVRLQGGAAAPAHTPAPLLRFVRETSFAEDGDEGRCCRCLRCCH